MRIALAQLGPVPGDWLANLEMVRTMTSGPPADLYVFPELFLSGYRVGDAFHALALAPGDPAWDGLGRIAQERGATLVVGSPVRHERVGEIENAALVATPDGAVAARSKRFLPTYGPFEEGATFTPGSTSLPVDTPAGRLGVQICYDAFFPEVSRDLALAGVELLVVLSAAPVTSRVLFDRVLPARAVENALPLVYVNRVGVEDGVVFGGGSMALDARGAELAAPPSDRRAEATVLSAEIDPGEARRWRPFRPVLRDVAGGRSAGARASADPGA